MPLLNLNCAKSGVSIIILQKTPAQIKHFFSTLENLDNDDDVQRYAQKIYAEDCFSLEKSLRSERYLLFCFRNTNQTVPTSLIRSSNRKQFIVGGHFEITLRLYQLRSCDRKHYEDILTEPFYPGTKATIYDIYCLLKSQSPFNDPGNLLSYRIQYDLRKKFVHRWQSLFGSTSLPLESFPLFLESIHSLDSKQLHVLFCAAVTFFPLFPQRSEIGD